ncbi:MAG: hypothetical protein JWO32_1438 [Bacteroidetes bacterium]|nr:hypothetical protein [Bacteroidota bacterium]
MTEQKIYYKKVRYLGEIFSACFGFIKQNFKTLYGSLLFYAGPFLLIAATVSAYMFGSSLGMNKVFRGGLTGYYSDLIVSYFVSLAVMLIGITVYNVILNRNILENEKLLPGEQLTLNHATKNFWPDFWRILGNTLILIFVLIAAVIVLALLFAGIFGLLSGSNGSGTGAIVLTIIAGILMFIAFLIFGPILMFVPMAALFVCQRDGLSIFPSMGKVFRYMKNNFWNTWIVSFLGFLTYATLASVAQIPVFIITFITTFSRLKSTVGSGIEDSSPSLLLVVVTVISALLSYGIMVIYHLIIVYQYTSLEEKKEGASIIDKINQI